MRAAGLSPARAGAMLAKIGLAFVLATFAVGEWIAPFSEEAAQQVRMRAMQSLIGGSLGSGLWFKDERSFINVREAREANALKGVRIYEFDSAYKLRQVTEAERGQYAGDGRWRLLGVAQTLVRSGGPDRQAPRGGRMAFGDEPGPDQRADRGARAHVGVEAL